MGINLEAEINSGKSFWKDPATNIIYNFTQAEFIKYLNVFAVYIQDYINLNFNDELEKAHLGFNLYHISPYTADRLISLNENEYKKELETAFHLDVDDAVNSSVYQLRLKSKKIRKKYMYYLVERIKNISYSDISYAFEILEDMGYKADIFHQAHVKGGTTNMIWEFFKDDSVEKTLRLSLGIDFDKEKQRLQNKGIGLGKNVSIGPINGKAVYIPSSSPIQASIDPDTLYIRSNNRVTTKIVNKCIHEYIKYQGLNEVFNHCKHCGVKENA